MRKRPCFECGAEAVENHHVVPRVVGGTRTVPLCAVCHGKAHAMERGDHRRLTVLGIKLARERGVKSGHPSLPVEKNRTSNSSTQPSAAPYSSSCRRRSGRELGHRKQYLP